MGFFFEAAKRERAAPKKPAARSKDIPIKSLNELGCSVCPRDKDRLETPKMRPSGANSPVLYVLAPAPTREDDSRGDWTAGKATRYISRLLPKSADRWARYGGVIQCATDTVAIGQHEMECCRSRVVEDIEEAKPLVILGIGDAPLAWATGLSANAPTFRGTLIVVKVGSHVCWYYPINYPNFVFSEKDRGYGLSEHEVALKFDIARLVDLLDRDLLPEPAFYGRDYAAGVETITGQDAGDFQRLERALHELVSAPRVGLDYETNGLRVYQRDPLLLTAAVGTFERTVAFSIDHPNGWASDHQRRRVHELFCRFLAESGTKVCHNLAMEMEWTAGIYDPRLLRLTEWDDTMSMAHSQDERPGTKSLDVQCLINFGFQLKSQSRVDVSRKNWWLEYDLEEILRYNGMDAKWTHKLDSVYLPRVNADPRLRWDHERKVRLASALVLTEYAGMPIDRDFAAGLAEQFAREAQQVEAKIMATPEVRKYEQRFGRFRPSSTDDVLKLMDKVLERPEVRRQERTGLRMTTGDEALSAMPVRQVPSAPLILELRGIDKINGTYILPALPRIDPTSKKWYIDSKGRLHPKYSSMRTVTGRLAGEDPNPQNFPKHKYRTVRGMVAALLGHNFVAVDYGQGEFRCAAMASEDPKLVEACWTDYDVHKYWAQRAVKIFPEIIDWCVAEFKIDWDEVGIKTLRQVFKNEWVFPCIFGASVKSRAGGCHLPLDKAEKLDDEFWDEFGGLKKWQKKVLANYEKNLYVETLGGIRRHGPMTMNEIINMPIQGTLAEIVQAAHCAVSERAQMDEDDNLMPIYNGHDDLSYIMDEARTTESISIVAHEMCQHRFDYINVPLLVEVSIGKRWHEVKEVAKYRSDVLFGIRNPYK